MKEYYPGSHQEVRKFGTSSAPAEEKDGDEALYLGDPVRVATLHNGETTEFYSTGQLAAALNRKSGTIRLWERNGTIPKPLFTVQSGNKYAKRRLYTRPQIEGLRRLAIEEGILSDVSRHITKTKFAERAKKLFSDLMKGSD